MLTGALKAGGIKMVYVVGKEGGTISEQVPILTTASEEAIPKLTKYFKDKEIGALGVAVFGPVDVEPESETCGCTLNTPRLAWRRRDLLGGFKAEPKVPMGLDTDVNGSCLGEVAYGCARGLDNVIYIAIGTGVDMGVCINRKLLHGVLHPEGEHILLACHEDNSKGGICPYHRNCLEGFADDPSTEAKQSKKVVELVDRSEVQEMENYYIAQVPVDYIMLFSPREITLGGGVMHQEQLFPMIHQKVGEMLNGYIKIRELEDMDSYIVPAGLHNDQGIMGCIKLGFNALQA